MDHPFVISDHAMTRMGERGISEHEIEECLNSGECSPANLGRSRFVLLLELVGVWASKAYTKKEVTVVAILENGFWVVVTVQCRYFTRG